MLSTDFFAFVEAIAQFPTLYNMAYQTIIDVGPGDIPIPPELDPAFVRRRNYSLALLRASNIFNLKLLDDIQPEANAPKSE